MEKLRSKSQSSTTVYLANTEQYVRLSLLCHGIRYTCLC